MPLLIVAVVLLFIVLVPGLGHVGQRQPALDPPARLQFPGVRARARARAHLHRELRGAPRGRAARDTSSGSLKPLGLLVLRRRCCCSPSRTSAPRRCCSSPASASCSSPARGCATCSCMTVVAARPRSALLADCCRRIACARLTAFLDPWADPYNSGFQLTQSLIAIGRGEWFGVGLGESVQKLFYLPEAHTDFLFAVLAEELGLVGVVADAGAVPRAGLAQLLHRAARVATPGCKFQSYLAAGFGLWLGIAGVHQHRREHGRAADQGPDAAAHELRPLEHDRDARVGRAAAARLSRGDAEQRAARRRVRGARAARSEERRHERAHPSSSWPAAPAGTCFRRWRWRACCARSRYEVVWLGTRRGLEARVVPAENIPIEWLSIGGLRGKGVAHAARRAVPARARARGRRCA